MNLLSSQLFLRLVAAGIVAAVAGATDGRVNRDIVFAIAFVHYVFALYYARNRARALVQQPAGVALMLGLGVLTAATYFWVPMFVYFGVHHVLNDVYMQGSHRPPAASETPTFRVVRVLLGACLYLAVVRGHSHAAGIPRTPLMAGIVLFGTTYLVLLFRITRPGLRQLLEIVSPEIVMVLFLAASLRLRVTFPIVAFYHIVFWNLSPFGPMRARADGSFRRYLIASVALTTLFLILTPEGILRGIGIPLFYLQFNLWTYVHITFSFGLSSSQPGWITRLFRSQVRLATATSTGA